MPLPHRTRKRLALLILLVGMPVYVVTAVTVVGLFERPPFWAELLIYVVLGVVWVLPFRGLFRGVAQPDHDSLPGPGQAPDRTLQAKKPRDPSA